MTQNTIWFQLPIFHLHFNFALLSNGINQQGTKPITGARGGTVVEALHCKPEGCGIDSRWCHWNFSST
jgi:hypothetical protein